MTFLAGLAISFVVFWALCRFFPVQGLGEDAPFMDESVVYTASNPVFPSEVGSQDGEKQQKIAVDAV